MGKFLTTEEWIQKAIKVHGDMYDYSKVEYKNSKEKVIIGCKKCVKDFKQSIEHHLSGKGCPYCRNSKGELLVTKILIENNIEFEPQKTFDKCKNKRLLPFDFYIPSLNILIEYDGKQHFKENIKNSIYCRDFEGTHLRDSIKDKYCIDNNIKLIRIPYTMKEIQIRDLLAKELMIL